MIRTGSSLVNAAKAFMAAGALKVSAMATHGVFPGNSLEEIKKKNIFSRLVCTDSHPRAHALKSEFLTVKSVAGIFVPYLKDEI